MAFMAWPEIEAFHNIRKFIRVDPTEWWKNKELMHGVSVVDYKCKVKLHGTNAAVQVHSDGTIICQSRENIITPEKDNAGFARWVKSNEEAWQRAMGFIFYGEWCGNGIQKGVAVSNIGKKVFAVFAARPLDDGDTLITEPAALYAAVGGIPDVYVLPWYDQSISIDWKQTDEQLSEAIKPINQWVDAIETNDPWVEATFGVKGTGEGLVFYPVSTPHLGLESFSNLTFKAKGALHKMISTAKPAQVSPEKANSIDVFVGMVLTNARLEQGAVAVGMDMKLTGKFVSWCLADVEKETQDELAASNLTWKQVQKSVSDRARSWYLEQAKK